MVENNLSKCTGQRKKRQDREACINNLRLSVNLGSSKERLGIHSRVGLGDHQRTYTKKPREKFLKGSLENVSSNPFGEESTLRRSRSLAITKEDVFTNLDVPKQRHRRSQLIPRAKLIERTRCVPGATTPDYERSLSRNYSLGKDYATLPQLLQTPQKNPLRASLSLTLAARDGDETVDNDGSISSINSNYPSKASLNNDFPYDCLGTGLSLPNYYPDSRYDTDNTDNISVTDNFSVTEIESSDNKRDSDTENSPVWNRGYSQRDSISYDENILLSTNSPLYDTHYAKPRTQRTIRGSTPYYKETHNYYTFTGKPHSLPPHQTPYDSDLSLSEEEVKYYEIEESTAQKIEINVKEEQNVSIGYYESDGLHLSDDKIKETKAESGESKEETKSSSNYSNIEANPLYDEVAASDVVFENFETKKGKNGEILSPIKTCVQVQAPVDHYLESTADNNHGGNCDDYKTIVSVESDSAKTKGDEKQHSHNYLREFLETQKGSKRPLQNFISKKISRAFGDKQNLSRRSSKGSTSTDSNLSDNQFYSLPDINISKNLRKCEKIDRKLRQCEKETKIPKTPKTPEVTGNRFIVNIGRHFDVTADTNIPVDFELKISKVPKKNKDGGTIRVSNKGEHQQQKRPKSFVEAVKDLKNTLNSDFNLDENHNVTKPEIIGVTTKARLDLPAVKSSSFRLQKEPLKRSHSYTKIPVTTTRRLYKPSGEEEKRIMDAQLEKAKECTREYQQKLDTMRNYWRKMAKSSDDDERHQDNNCRVVDVTTKVEEVIKKFEPKEDKEEEKQPNIVQLTKQIFEQKPVEKKQEKLSPFVKETCEIFENPFYEKDTESGQYESLNPNIVEIVEKDISTTRGNAKSKKKTPKGVLQTNNGNTTKNNIVDDNNTKIDKDKNVKTKEINNKVETAARVNQESLLKPKNVADPEFDHVRYRVMKSDLFQKKIFANCEKESQFDGLMQYLQDYSFQELLIDNNIVIIEPIRTKVHHEASHIAKSPHNVTPLLHKSTDTVSANQSSGLRRHFFYHPIRVNKEVNEDELPNPDTVKQVRQFFECGLQRSQSSQNLVEVNNKLHRSVDPDKDRCSTSDSNSNPSTSSVRDSNENLYDSFKNEICCEQQYVSEDILEKIRECGTSVTYYGGRVLNKHNGRPSLTKAIMEEIKGNEKRNKDCLCGKLSEKCNLTSRKNNFGENDDSVNNKDVYQGVKFKLLKSNSCSSRLELVGTNNNLQEYRKKFLSKQKQLIEEHNLKNKNAENGSIEEVSLENSENFDSLDLEEAPLDKNAINENIKKCQTNVKQPKIIGEERKIKMTQWGDAKEEKTYTSIKFSSSNNNNSNNNNSNNNNNNNNNNKSQKIQYDYHINEKLKTRPKNLDEMEFEPYEIAGN